MLTNYTYSCMCLSSLSLSLSLSLCLSPSLSPLFFLSLQQYPIRSVATSVLVSAALPSVLTIDVIVGIKCACPFVRIATEEEGKENGRK